MEHSAPVRFLGSYKPNFFPALLGLPTAIIPGTNQICFLYVKLVTCEVGHAPFLSRVTNRTEYLPATAGLVGGPGKFSPFQET